MVIATVRVRVPLRALIMKIEYTPVGTCSRLVEIEVNDGVVVDLHVTGGCHGNLQGIAALCRGRRVEDVAGALRGIRCGHKATSCPDQIAKALDSIG